MNLQRIVPVVMTASQTAKFENERTLPVFSKAAAFVVLRKVAVAGLITRSMLWLPGERCERE